MPAKTTDTQRLDDLVLACAGRVEALAALAPRADVEAALGRLRAAKRIDAAGKLPRAEQTALRRRLGLAAAARLDAAAICAGVIPALALGIAARPLDRDALAAAIVGRATGTWRDGAPPSVARLCDALVWRALGLPGTPKRSPAEVRAHFAAQLVGGGRRGPAAAMIRLAAAKEVAAARPDAKALREALVRRWLAGEMWSATATATATAAAAGTAAGTGTGTGAAPATAAPPRTPTPTSRPAPTAARPVPAAGSASPAPSRSRRIGASRAAAPALADLAAAIRAAARAATTGVFGDRKVFISAVWRDLRGRPPVAELDLDGFKRQLVAAHRAGLVSLARADLVHVMDPVEVAASETASAEARYHFIVRDRDAS